MSKENFIPWEQIEPLIRPGMTGHEIADAVLAMVGLPQEQYTIIGDGSRGGSVREILQHGVTIMKVGQTGPRRAIGDEVYR